MINFTANNWLQAWRAIHHLYDDAPDQVIDKRFASRAVSFSNRITILSNELDGLSHKMAGYTDYKLSLFDRNYITPGHKEEIGEKLLERITNNRPLTTLSYNFNQENKSHVQGPCVINITIVLFRKNADWHIRFICNMRVAEITRRMLVDFIKFHQLIDYWMDLLKDYHPILDFIEFNSPVVYAESISLELAMVTIDELKFEQDHWLHRAVQKQIQRNPDNMAFKRGKRIKKNIRRMQEAKNDKQ